MTIEKPNHSGDFKFQQKWERRKDGSLRVSSLCPEPSMTQQQHKDDCDINNIMKKYETTGEFTANIRPGGAYADFSQITDYRDMVDAVRYADEAFASLPALVRKRFENDPAQLLAFMQDPKNLEEGIKLGLMTAPKVAPDDKRDEPNNANSPQANPGAKQKRPKIPSEQKLDPPSADE